MHDTSKIVKAIYHKDKAVLELTEPLSLEEGAEVTVTVTPETPLTEAERDERFLRAAGAWKGLVDEKFKENLRTMRRVSTRPEIEPWQ